MAPLLGLVLGGALCQRAADPPPPPPPKPARTVGVPPPAQDVGTAPDAPSALLADPDAAAAVPAGPKVPLDDPSGQAMDAFFAKLRALEAGEPGVKARVLHYGDSHVAADIWSGALRRAWQARFGDGGAGFMLPGKPWKSYRHLDVRNGTSRRKDWRSERARGKRGVKDGLYGLGGVTSWSDKPGASVWVATDDDQGPLGTLASRFEVYYLRQPKGGRFEVRLNGAKVETVKTRGKPTGPGYVSFARPEAAAKLEVIARGGGDVRLFGLVMERDAGLVYDAQGINGARAITSKSWDVPLWKAHLKRRAPDLIITTYGTNEAASNVTPARYTAHMERLWTTLRDGAPDASCLILGLPDYARPDAKTKRGEEDEATWTTPPLVADLIEAQRTVARRFGCAFWDTSAAMGGPGSIDQWARQDPPLGLYDRVHLTWDGYTRVAEELDAAVMASYRAYLEANPAP